MKKYTLHEYLTFLKEDGYCMDMIGSCDHPDETVNLVSCDSNEVVPGTLFLCKGAHFKSEYLKKAAARGAIFYISEKEYPLVALPHCLVRDIRPVMSRLASIYYNDPWKKLHVIGVTGTKGKSTTTYFIKSVLDTCAQKRQMPEAGIIGGIQIYDGMAPAAAHLTTPEPLELERHFANAVDNGLQYVTMEVSSQALKYDRVCDVTFDTGVFLNIGYDHISPIEHPTWEDYFTSKLKIFNRCRTGIVNLDSEHAHRILEAARHTRQVLTFSEKDPYADIYGYDVHKEHGDTVFSVRTASFDRVFRLGIPGLFNVSNALAAIAVCMHYQVPADDIYEGLLRTRVPGRMEVYTDAGRYVTAIVDFAHNGMSFEKLFESTRKEYSDHRIVIVFGCPGGKALNRRHDMGTVAGRLADYVYITEDDPGSEDVPSICRQIAEAVRAQGCPYSIIPDRAEAIHTAILEADKNTVVLIAGKGADTTIKRAQGDVPFISDADNAKDALRAYDARMS